MPWTRRQTFGLVDCVISWNELPTHDHERSLVRPGWAHVKTPVPFI